MIRNGRRFFFLPTISYLANAVRYIAPRSDDEQDKSCIVSASHLGISPEQPALEERGWHPTIETSPYRPEFLISHATQREQVEICHEICALSNHLDEDSKYARRVVMMTPEYSHFEKVH